MAGFRNPTACPAEPCPRGLLLSELYARIGKQKEGYFLNKTDSFFLFYIFFVKGMSRRRHLPLLASPIFVGITVPIELQLTLLALGKFLGFLTTFESEI